MQGEGGGEGMSNPNEQEQSELQQLIEQVELDLARERGRLNRVDARERVEHWHNGKLERVVIEEQEDMYKTQEIPLPEQYKTSPPARPDEDEGSKVLGLVLAGVIKLGVAVVRMKEWYERRQAGRRARKGLLEPILTQAQIDGGLQGRDRRWRGIGVISLWRKEVR